MSTSRTDADAESSIEDGFSIEDMTPPVASETSSAQSPKAASSITGLSVCPFCGSIAEAPGEACRRCSMENNAMTRQATRARIGPWYVMQSRNPSAPGMKYNTLLTLIRKGQVTPQSVMRGPTTHQLWRFAAKVKGISREFGLCYSCGGSLERSASVCPICSRLQDLPANPDTLLETESPTNKAVYVEAKPPPPSPAPAKIPPATPASASNGNGSSSEPRTSPPRAAAPKQPAVESRPTRNEIQKPPPVAPNRSSTEPVLSAKELAAAFSLQFVPNAKQSILSRPGAMKKLVIAVSLGVVIAAVSIFTMVPMAHDTMVGWWKRIQAKAASSSPPAPSSSTTTIQDEIRRAEAPAWGMKPPVVSQPITTPASPPTAPDNSTTPAPQAVAITPPAAKQQPAPQPKDPAPAALSNTGPAKDPLPQISLADMDILAMQLRSNGLDAEAKHDYASAQSFYEQIEKLPRSHWPADTDQLLQAAKQKNQ